MTSMLILHVEHIFLLKSTTAHAIIEALAYRRQRSFCTRFSCSIESFSFARSE